MTLHETTFANELPECIQLHFAELCAVGVMQWILVNRLSSRRLYMCSTTRMISY